MGDFNINKRRKELNLTLEQVGNYVGVSKSTVKKWETGYIDNMKRDKIALLATVLQVSPLKILGIDDERDEHTCAGSEFNELDKNEITLLKSYRSLSKQGKEYILQTMDMAVSKYKKDNISTKTKIG